MYKNSTKAFVYVIDSSTVQKEIKDAAEYVDVVSLERSKINFSLLHSFLYTLLADKALSSVPVLVLCNKQDETMSKGQSVIEQLLEKEM